MESLDNVMEKLEDKTNNQILLEIKQLEQEHESLKMVMLRDYDSIELLKAKMKKDFERMETVEKRFNEANEIVVRRLKGNA